MKRQVYLVFLMIWGLLLLEGCRNMGYFDEPVEVSSQLKANMDEAVQKLDGRWVQVKQGTSRAHFFNLTFKDSNKVVVEHRGKEESIYKLGYDWKYTTNNGGRSLVGHILFYSSYLSVPYICIIEEGDKTMALCPDDGGNYVEDPTMYFEKSNALYAESNFASTIIGKWELDRTNYESSDELVKRATLEFDAEGKVVYDGNIVSGGKTLHKESDYSFDGDWEETGEGISGHVFFLLWEGLSEYGGNDRVGCKFINGEMCIWNDNYPDAVYVKAPTLYYFKRIE